MRVTITPRAQAAGRRSKPLQARALEAVTTFGEQLVTAPARRMRHDRMSAQQPVRGGWRVPWPHVWLLSAIAVATTHKWLIRRAGILLTLVVKRMTSLDLSRRVCRCCASQHGPALKFPAELGQDRC